MPAASLAAGVNFLPWTGPMIRASASLKLPIPEIFGREVTIFRNANSCSDT